MKHKGFTLIELMVVVVIIGILAAIAIPNFMSMRDRAKESSTKSNMHTLQLSAEDFSTMCEGLYPVNPTTDVMTILNALLGGGSTNAKMIADACPGTRATVSTTVNALLPGNLTYGNPFLATANSLDLMGFAEPPAPPAHNAAIGANVSGTGTSFWAPCGVQGAAGECTAYAIYGDGKDAILDLTLRSGQ